MGGAGVAAAPPFAGVAAPPFGVVAAPPPPPLLLPGVVTPATGVEATPPPPTGVVEATPSPPTGVEAAAPSPTETTWPPPGVVPPAGDGELDATAPPVLATVVGSNGKEESGGSDTTEAGCCVTGSLPATVGCWVTLPPAPDKVERSAGLVLAGSWVMPPPAPLLVRDIPDSEPVPYPYQFCSLEHTLLAVTHTLSCGRSHNTDRWNNGASWNNGTGW